MNKQSEKLRVKGEKYKICATDFEGITLVALVITIIVLIILAGVSINAVMNQGLITNAKDAKSEYEDEKVKEETALKDMEVLADFETSEKNINYKFRNGFLTNINVENKIIETVESVENNLPDGYTIYDVNENPIEAKATTAAGTGMIIKKGTKEIGRIVVFGDVKIDEGSYGSFDGDDCTWIMNIYEKPEQYADYQIVASDVNHDGVINYEDASNLNSYRLSISFKVEQNANAYSADELKIISYAEYKQNIINNVVPQEFKTEYSLYFDEEEDDYILKLPSDKELTAIEMLTKLGEGYENSEVWVYDAEKNYVVISIEKTPDATDVVKAKDKLKIYKGNESITVHMVVE